MPMSYNAGCYPGLVNDAEIQQQIQLMEETHRLTVQQMVVAHNSELENLASKICELQSELQTKSVSIKFWAVCFVCYILSVMSRKNEENVF